MLYMGTPSHKKFKAGMSDFYRLDSIAARLCNELVNRNAGYKGLIPCVLYRIH